MSAAPLNAIPWEYKVNETVNTFLLAGDKFVPEICLKQPRFTLVLVDPLQKTKKEFKNLKNKAFNIAKRPKYDGYQRSLAAMVYNFFDK